MHRRLRIARPVERIMVALVFLALASAVASGQPSVRTPNGLKLVFEDRFDQGLDRWETTDDASWGIVAVDKNPSLELNKSISAYAPKVRSPHNIAMIRNLQASDFVMTFRVRSLDDWNAYDDVRVYVPVESTR